MSSAHLATYLNDHLAGSVGARELLAHLRSTPAARSLDDFLAGLEEDIAAKQEILRDLMRRIGVPESTVRQTAAWLGEKIGRFKLGMGDPDPAPMSLFEALEALLLGLRGQRALWIALAEVAPHLGPWSGVSFDRLAREARLLAEAVDAKRVELAGRVLIPDEVDPPLTPVPVLGQPQLA